MDVADEVGDRVLEYGQIVIGASGTPANLSAAGRANCSASSSCPSPSTLTTKRRLVSIASWVGSRLLMQTRSRIGSSESEATALAVIPAGLSSCRVVITVTPGREMGDRLAKGELVDGQPGHLGCCSPAPPTCRRTALRLTDGAHLSRRRSPWHLTLAPEETLARPRVIGYERIHASTERRRGMSDDQIERASEALRASGRPSTLLRRAGAGGPRSGLPRTSRRRAHTRQAGRSRSAGSRR